jgi:hypothetical protein
MIRYPRTGIEKKSEMALSTVLIVISCSFEYYGSTPFLIEPLQLVIECHHDLTRILAKMQELMAIH